MIKKLLCGIYRDNKIYNMINIEEITGKQQNYLLRFDDILDLKEKYKNNIQKLQEELNFLNLRSHLHTILPDLTNELQTESGEIYSKSSKEFIYELPIEDIFFILISIRSISYHNKLQLVATCKSCNTIQKNVIIDLDTLEKEHANPKDSLKEIITPNNHKIILKRKTLKEALEIENVYRNHPKDIFTYSLFLSIESMNGESISTEKLESLKARDNNFILEEISKLNIKYDVNIEHNCENCKQDIIFPLPVLDPFFFTQSEIHSAGYLRNLLPTDLI